MCVTVAAGLRSGSWIQAAVPGLVSNTGAVLQRDLRLFDAVVQRVSAVIPPTRLSHDSPPSFLLDSLSVTPVTLPWLPRGSPVALPLEIFAFFA